MFQNALQKSHINQLKVNCQWIKWKRKRRIPIYHHLPLLPIVPPALGTNNHLQLHPHRAVDNSKPSPQKIDRDDLRECRSKDANTRKAKLDAEQGVVLQAREKERNEKNKVSCFCICNAIVVYTSNCLYIQHLYCILFYMIIIAVFWH